jgi:hypothetical protein|tara:strand:- start:571 stop:738 length:168 start_codon:yes stop_codon:yes gene_type:complete
MSSSAGAYREAVLEMNSNGPMSKPTGSVRYRPSVATTCPCRKIGTVTADFSPEDE